ncbi:MAG: NlpC/P60 family protein, partial [Firmicutes bacterium]|nr:NlpC/P60 family protein [Bacillota bacterium]
RGPIPPGFEGDINTLPSHSFVTYVRIVTQAEWDASPQLPPDGGGASGVAAQVLHQANLRNNPQTRRIWGGNGINFPGYDSSGFVIAVYREAGVTLPTQGSGGMGHQIFTALSAQGKIHQTGQPGDIVFWRNGPNGTIMHSGIYTGNRTQIHMSGPAGNFIGHDLGAGHMRTTTWHSATLLWSNQPHTFAGFGRP